jgi:hypothetical protein
MILVRSHEKNRPNEGGEAEEHDGRRCDAAQQKSFVNPIYVPAHQWPFIPAGHDLENS